MGIILGFTEGINGPQIYVDGVNQSRSGAGSAKSIIGSSSGFNFTLGRSSGASNKYFDGDIDEVSVWNKSLNASEILALYNLGVSSVSANTSFTTALGSTNFATVANLSNVTNMKLADTSGSIIWNNGVDATNQDYDSAIDIGSGFVFVNSSALDSSANSSANISIDVNSCDTWSIYNHDGVVTSLANLKSLGSEVGTGTGATGSCTSVCSNPTCVNNVLTFTVGGFSSHGGDGEGSTPDVPEFSDYAIMFILIVTIGGFFSIRKKQ